MSALPAQLPPQSFADDVRSAKLGLLHESNFQPVWVSKTPYQLTHAQWRDGWSTAQALGALFESVSQQPEWLINTLGSALPNALTHQLTRRLPLKEPKSSHVSVTRHDLMLDEQRRWKLIESNSIAAGMGPFSHDLSELLKAQDNRLFAPNGATPEQAHHLYSMACSNRGVLQPTLVFVVEPFEDNIYDHQKLEAAITALGGRVLVKTLRELERAQELSAERFFTLTDEGIVDLLYFRTGYNLQDYEDQNRDVTRLLDLRAQFEMKTLKLCPTIAGQLATHKSVQRALSKYRPEQLKTTFSLTADQALLAFRALAVEYKNVNPQTLSNDLSSGRWLLKSVGEGGGNTTDSLTDSHLTTLGDEHFLMQRIHPLRRTETVTLVNDESVRLIDGAISELGFFTLGPQQRFGGYLLRTKSNRSVECGVHKGYGAIDAVVFSDQIASLS